MTALNLNVGPSSFDRDMPDFEAEELAAMGMHVTGAKSDDKDEEEEESVEAEVAGEGKKDKEKEKEEEESEIEEVDELEELARLEKELKEEDAPVLTDEEE